MHDVLYAHRPSFLTLRLFEQVLEEVHRTALTSRLGMLCRHVANIGNMSTQHPKARCQRRTVHFLQNLLEKAQRQERGSMRIQHIMHIDPLKAISPKPSHQWRGQGDSNPPWRFTQKQCPVNIVRILNLQAGRPASAVTRQYVRKFICHN